ncbi:MAG: hypothetical protein WD065_13350 [Planctomycetaceae bacterium]
MNIAGIEFSVSISPFDSPISIGGRYFKDCGEFVIDFNYVDSEPAVTKRFEGMQFEEGRHSGKLIRIKIPVDKKNIDLVKLQTMVVKSLESRRRKLPAVAAGRLLNSRVAEEVFSSEKDFQNIAGELVTSGWD